MVKLPVLTMPSDLFNYFVHPDLSFLRNVNCYIIAFTLAIVGSLETMLGAEATDKFDSERMITPTNREFLLHKAPQKNSSVELINIKI